MIRAAVITDELWALIAPVLPWRERRPGQPWRDHRQVLKMIAWRYRTGRPWRDVPALPGLPQLVGRI